MYHPFRAASTGEDPQVLLGLAKMRRSFSHASSRPHVASRNGLGSADDTAPPELAAGNGSVKARVFFGPMTGLVVEAGDSRLEVHCYTWLRAETDTRVGGETDLEASVAVGRLFLHGSLFDSKLHLGIGGQEGISRSPLAYLPSTRRRGCTRPLPGAASLSEKLTLRDPKDRPLRSA